MNRSVAEYIEMCQWDTARFFIVSDNVFASLIYYSHLLPFVATLLFAVFLFIQNRKILAIRWFFVTAVLLSIWLLSDLVLWAHQEPSIIMFFWSLMILVEPIIYAGTLFFIYAFLYNKSLSFKQIFIIFLLFLPIILLLPTKLTLVEFDLSNCWREPFEGLMAFYPYFLGSLFTLWVLVVGIKSFFEKKDNKEKRKALFITLSSIFFLISFTIGNAIGSLFVDWNIAQYGLFGIPIFVAILAYIVVKYNTFNVKVIATQILVAALWILTFSIIFLRSIENVRIIVAITLIFFTILGYSLIKSVKREVEQRERIERLAKDLEEANKAQENLIHFITHQVKGFFTKSRNIFAELLDGTFGKINGEVKQMAEEGLRANTEAVGVVENILKASNIKKGTIEYEKKEIDLKKMVEEAVEKMRPVAEKKGLDFQTDIKEEDYNFVGDRTQLEQVFHNLMDNAVKYTPKGEVKVSLVKSDNSIKFSVKDSGVGITPEDKKRLFTEGGKGKDSTKVNVDSTGYGLYIVKGIVEAHGGRVWAESEGQGKGSTFIVELSA